jgi:hypothetical protein
MVTSPLSIWRGAWGEVMYRSIVQFTIRVFVVKRQTQLLTTKVGFAELCFFQNDCERILLRMWLALGLREIWSEKVLGKRASTLTAGGSLPTTPFLRAKLSFAFLIRPRLDDPSERIIPVQAASLPAWTSFEARPAKAKLSFVRKKGGSQKTTPSRKGTCPFPQYCL